MSNLQKKLDWRLFNLMTAQKRIQKKVEQLNIIIKLRRENEMSLRKIGKEVGMSGQNVNNILKVWGLK